MTTVGFKRLTIGILDDAGQVIDSHVLEGKQDEGATITAAIDGLFREPTVVHGSDIAYYTSRKGTGTPTVNLGLLDIPETFSDKMLGYQVETDGIAYHGVESEAPNCSIMLESSNMQGDKVLLGFFKGVFTMGTMNLETKSSDNTAPAPTDYVYTPVHNDKEGVTEGQLFGKYVGSEQATITKLNDQVFPGLAPTA